MKQESGSDLFWIPASSGSSSKLRYIPPLLHSKMNLMMKNPTMAAATGSPKRVWRPRTAEEITLTKNRKIVNQHLKKIGRAASRDLSLDEDGRCCFSFKKFVVVIAVPEHDSSICYFYTKVCHLSPLDNEEEVFRFQTIFNQRQFDSGAKLSTKGEEVNLCLSVPIHGLTFDDMAAHLEYFLMKMAVSVNRKLQQVKSVPLPLPIQKSKQLLEEAEKDAKSDPSSSPSVSRRLRMWSMSDFSANSHSSSQGGSSIFSALFSSNRSLDS